jgi:hypothetical protein
MTIDSVSGAEVPEEEITPAMTEAGAAEIDDDLAVPPSYRPKLAAARRIFRAMRRVQLQEARARLSVNPEPWRTPGYHGEDEKPCAEPTEGEMELTRDQEVIGQAIAVFAEDAIRDNGGLFDIWDEINTTERLAECLAPLVTAAREEGRREAIEECASLAEGIRAYASPRIMADHMAFRIRQLLSKEPK